MCQLEMPHGSAELARLVLAIPHFYPLAAGGQAGRAETRSDMRHGDPVTLVRRFVVACAVTSEENGG